MERETLEQRRRHLFFVRHAFVEGDNPKAGRNRFRDPVALDRQLAAIEDAGDARRHARTQPLRHRNHDNATVGLGQYAGLHDRPAGAEGGDEIDAPQKAIVFNSRRQAFHGRPTRKQSAKAFIPKV